MSLRLERRVRRKLLTTCPLCKRGIFEGDATARIPGHLGPVHLVCPS